MFCTEMVQQCCSCSALPAPKTQVIVAQTATRQLCSLLCWLYTWVKTKLGLLLQQPWSCGSPCPAVALILRWSHVPVLLQEPGLQEGIATLCRARCTLHPGPCSAPSLAGAGGLKHAHPSCFSLPFLSPLARLAFYKSNPQATLA